MKKIITILIVTLFIATGCTLANQKKSTAIKCKKLYSSECSQNSTCDQITNLPNTAPGTLGILGFSQYCVPKGDNDSCAKFATQKSCLSNEQCAYANIKSSGVCYIND